MRGSEMWCPCVRRVAATALYNFSILKAKLPLATCAQPPPISESAKGESLFNDNIAVFLLAAAAPVYQLRRARFLGSVSASLTHVCSGLLLYASTAMSHPIRFLLQNHWLLRAIS